MARTRLQQLLNGSKLMVLTLAGFLIAYAVLGYFMFSKGLGLMERVPTVGGFLTDRIIYLIFFFFLVMLIFSTGVTNFIGLIKGREIRWLLTMPLSHRAIFLWKSTEAIVFASWGLVFISAPLLLAFAASRGAPWTFYPKALLVLIPFVAIAATLGNALFLCLLRWAPRRAGVVLAIAGFAGLMWYGFDAYRDVVRGQQTAMATVAIDQILKHTEVSVHPLSPSTWISKVLVQWTRALQHDVWLYVAQLWSTALVAMLLMGVLGRFWFYPGWNRSLERAAAAASRRRDRAGENFKKWTRGTRRILGVGRPLRAVIRKDALCFVREPSQWIQFLIVFGLLLVYVLNLRNMGYDIDNPFWSAIISYINLTVCSLALSTLTTRFVFPLFSLEGSRLWILGMAPVGLDKIVLQKWLQSVLFTGSLTTLLQFVSGVMLGLTWVDIAFFAFSVAMMSVGLCGIAVGLGALFPNLEETNAAKIVSGFGGTLCLIVSFCYIGGLVSVLCVAKIAVFRTRGMEGEVSGSEGWMTLALLGATALTLIFGGLPLSLAMRRAKRMQLLGPLS